MLIIEGPDGSGKTTLIKQLRKRYDFVTVGLGGPTKDIYNMERALRLMRYLSAIGFACEQADLPAIPVVWDRHPLISEPIYGQILRKSTLLPDPEELLPAHSVVVYCRPPTDVILRGMKSFEQLEGVHDQALVLIRRYDQVMSRVGECITYDWTHPADMDRLIDIIDREGILS